MFCAGEVRGTVRGILIVAMLISIMLTGVSPFLASAESPDTDPEETGEVSILYDDSSLELGTEWVNDYNQSWLGDLRNTGQDVNGLYGELRQAGVTRRWNYGNRSAWEQEWKGRYKPGGGTEHLYIDKVDLAYFSGHGSATGFYFGKGGELHDDVTLSYSDCRNEWGNDDLDWVALSACQTLKTSSGRSGWAGCMSGLRLILGFETPMSDSAIHGSWFGYYLRKGYDFRSAWFKATKRTQAWNAVAGVLAESSSYYHDKLANHRSSTYVDNKCDYSSRMAQFGAMEQEKSPAVVAQVDIGALDGTMPVFETVPLSLAEADERWNDLGQAFGVTVSESSLDLMASSDEMGAIRTSTDAQLMMDDTSGLYSFSDMDRLWAEPPAVSVNTADMRPLAENEPQAIADQFLNDHGLMPEGAWSRGTFADVSEEFQLDEASDSLVTLASITEAYEVIYTRIITYTPAGEDPVTFDLVGPGAQTVVYVAPEVTATSSILEAAETSIIGLEGGFRQIDASATSDGLTAQSSVPILTEDQADMVFLELAPMLALNYIPVVSSNSQILSHTLAYYEHGMGLSQDQLIPVYVLTVEYTTPDSQSLGASETQQELAYIPANSEFMAPYAAISVTSPITDLVFPGQQISLEAADASQPLSNHGFDPSLNFAPGTGDPDSYLYMWYLNSIEDENSLGSGRSLNYTVPAIDANRDGLLIVLEVFDSLSPRAPSMSTAVFQLALPTDVQVQAYLPIIVKHRGAD